MKIEDIISSLKKSEKNLCFKHVNGDAEFHYPVKAIKYLFTKKDKSRYYFLYVNGSENKTAMLFREERVIESGTYIKKRVVKVKRKK